MCRLLLLQAWGEQCPALFIGTHVATSLELPLGSLRDWSPHARQPDHSWRGGHRRQLGLLILALVSSLAADESIILNRTPLPHSRSLHRLVRWLAPRDNSFARDSKRAHFAIMFVFGCFCLGISCRGTSSRGRIIGAFLAGMAVADATKQPDTPQQCLRTEFLGRSSWQYWDAMRLECSASQG